MQRRPGVVGGAELYLKHEAIGAGTVVLVHLVDNQEDDTGEEGQGKEDQHRDLRAEARQLAGKTRERRHQPGMHSQAPGHRNTKPRRPLGTRGQQHPRSLGNFLYSFHFNTPVGDLYC